MLDRYKFRAWNKEEKRMYYDAQDTYDYITGQPTIPAERFATLLEDEKEWVVEQCVGIKDKNGNLIYEGDYIKDWRGDVYKVVWLDEYAQFFCENINDATDGYHFDESIHDMCICGNIHEQAEQKDK